ncbi:sigma-54 dependent transcriptional regulator [Moritella sp.]|uniref:sigma-54-dependent transcriptional regulator n=1 Tax=Moritella sp. TaxID=78556 RepID=UPI001DED57D0|nr:sigma-54 dependent transcriptional regulator [Moritella sp.]MCJ8349446.1 sigma-54 dependent transcriptional regulator [Moritella sp.]NQZ39239.1 sigma-54-dependent Fis family transcriptional regulator [Moritella sp.]
MSANHEQDNILLILESSSVTRLDSKELEQQGYVVHRCLNADDAFLNASTLSPAVVLVDAELVDMSLVSFVNVFSRNHPDSVIIVMVQSSQCELAAEAIVVGAADYLLKPFSDYQLIKAIKRAESLRKPMDDFIICSAESRQVVQLAHRAAQTDATVFIRGESGTGKELLARYIHTHSPRADGPFVAFNCAAMPESMIEAMLFGHTKGAYTGATNELVGKFELANNGTIMLDEIAEMPLQLQAKLLRVIQEREVERLGSNKKIKLNIRIIAATNKNLQEAVEKGLFRQDLYYRLDVLPLQWGALRERKDDILPLAEFFIRKYAPTPDYFMSSAAKLMLLGHAWPGNVRELENVIQRALIIARGMEIQVADLMLPAQLNEKKTALKIVHQSEGLESTKKRAEYQYVLDTLKQFKGHRMKTAAALGVTTRALRYKMVAMREQGIAI